MKPRLTVLGPLFVFSVALLSAEGVSTSPATLQLAGFDTRGAVIPANSNTRKTYYPGFLLEVAIVV